MGKRARILIISLALFVIPLPAFGEVKTEENGSCGAGCTLYRISVSGRIDGQMQADFLKAADDERVRRTAQFFGPIVRLNSPGGSVAAAMAIGDAIRTHNYWTAVYEHNDCASACVLILAAGVNRVAAWGRIIIHRPHFEEESFGGLAPAQARAKYEQMAAQVRDYLSRMGMPDALYQAMLKVPSDDSRVLTVKNVKEYGLEGEDPAWAEWWRAKMIAAEGREQYDATMSMGTVLSACINSPHMAENSLPVANGKCEREIRPAFEAKLRACADKTGDEFAACAKAIATQMAAKYR